jgi:hypothetical protein
MKSVNEIQFSLNSILTKDLSAFNKFIKLSSLNPVEIYNLLNENIVVNVNEKSTDNFDQSNILVSQYPELKTVNSIDEAIEILKRNLWLSSNEDVENFLTQKGIKKDNLFSTNEVKSKAQYFTELVLNYWENKISNTSNFDYFISNGLSQNSLSFLAEHWNKIIDNRKIKIKLERILNDVVSETATNRGVEEFLAETFSLIINEIVMSFDLNYFTNDELVEIENLKSNNNFNFYNPIKIIDANTIKNLFENNTDERTTVNSVVLEKYNKWIEFFRISLLVNCGFVNYDEKANHQLKELVNSFNEFKLN